MRWVVAAFCALGAALPVAAPADAQSPPPSFLIPTRAIALPPPLAGGVVGSLATDSSGNLYAAVDSVGHAFVAVFTPTGTLLRRWQVDALQTLRTHIVLTVGPDGLVYVAPSGGAAGDEAVRVFTPDGIPVRSFGQGSGLREVNDIEVDGSGNVYVTARRRPDLGFPDDMVVRFDSRGAITARIAPLPGTSNNFANSLKGLAVAPSNSLYLTTEVESARIVGLDSAGARLPIPNFTFVIPGDVHHYEDIEIANGTVYLAGEVGETQNRNPFGVAALTPQGKLLSLVAGESRHIAVSGRELYATGIHALAGPSSTRRADTHKSDEIAIVRDSPTRIPGNDALAGSVGGPCDRETYYRDDQGIWQVDRALLRGQTVLSPPCDMRFQNFGSPCPPGTVDHVPSQTYIGGTPFGRPRVLRGSVGRPSELAVEVVIPRDSVHSGPVVVEWACVDASDRITPAYDWKGTINLVDPSGVVVDGATGRPVGEATVRLQFALRRGGPFGTPGVAGFTPQTNPQVTGRKGAFGWDVAPGFWRLRISAFGYRPFTSPVYSVPPEVTGLRLKLRPDPRQQARLLDPYAGRAGRARIGARLARGLRVQGLVLRARGGRIRSVTVKARRFRTGEGIALGSRETALRDAYPSEAASALARTKAPTRYRVGKAAFTVRRGRVVGIALGR